MLTVRDEQQEIDMQIEAGKYYRTRDGRKVGPMVNYMWEDGEPWSTPEPKTYWGNCGKWDTSDPEDSRNDLVAEWTDGPVRTETVTKRRIVPGVYGRLRVGDRYGTGVWVEVTEGKGGSLALTATELDELAMVASQLAEALRDGMD